MLGYYYLVICIKAMAANDETMHSVSKIGFVAACSLIFIGYMAISLGGGGSCYADNMKIRNCLSK